MNYELSGHEYIRRLIEEWRLEGLPDQCVEWSRARLNWGYGLLTLNKKRLRAHLYAWELWHGEPFPTGLEGTHSCDNPPCFNPAHIVPATHAQNMQQAAERRRIRGGAHPGEDHHMAKLSWEQVRHVRRSHALGVSSRALAAELSVSYGTIRLIVRNRTWREAS